MVFSADSRLKFWFFLKYENYPKRVKVWFIVSFILNSATVIFVLVYGYFEAED